MLLEVDDERKLAVFMDRKIGQEVPLDSLEEGFAGYQVRISGGLDKQGFPMKQGISTAHRVRVLLGKRTYLMEASKCGGVHVAVTVCVYV